MVLVAAGRGTAAARGDAPGAAGHHEVAERAAGPVVRLGLRVLARTPGDWFQCRVQCRGQPGRTRHPAALAGGADGVAGAAAGEAGVGGGGAVGAGGGDAPPAGGVLPGGVEQVHRVVLVQQPVPGQLSSPGRAPPGRVPGHDQDRVDRPAAPPATAPDPPLRALARTLILIGVRVLARTRVLIAVRVLARTLVRVVLGVLARTPVSAAVLARVRAWARTRLGGSGAAEEEVQHGLHLELPGGPLHPGGVQVQSPPLDILPGDLPVRVRQLPRRQAHVPRVLLERPHVALPAAAVLLPRRRFRVQAGHLPAGEVPPPAPGLPPPPPPPPHPPPPPTLRN